MSLWINNQLSALKPDILAADFLAYCLEQWAENQEAEWIFAAIGLSRIETDEDVNNQKLQGNFSRLGRLIFDARSKLEIKDFSLMGALCRSIRKKSSYSAWVAEHLANTDLEPDLRVIFVEALKFLLTRPIDPPTEALTLRKLSTQLSERGEKEGAFAAIRRAVEIYEELAEENSTIYGPGLASSLHNLSVCLVEKGDNEGALEAIQRAVAIREKLAEENRTTCKLGLASSLHILSFVLARSGDKCSGLIELDTSR